MRLDVPGPDPLPIATLRFARDPYRYFSSCRRRLGPVFQSWLAGNRIVLSGEPEHVRTIFAADHDTAGAFNPGHLEALLGKHSLILIDGARHQSERKLLSPPLHGARMRSYAGIVRESALHRAAAWRVGAPLVMQDATQALSLDVIVKAVFGVQEPARVAAFEAALLATMSSVWMPAVLIRGLQRDLGPLTPWRRFARARDHADALIREEIAVRRRAPPGDDILSLMISARYDDGEGMRDDQIRDELMTLLAAGHETTAIALAWAMYWLHRHPDTLERLRAELALAGDDLDAIASLPYLDAVCHETLRLYPIVPLAPRTLRRPLTLGPHTLPPGTHVGACIALLHRHPDLYPEPDEFRPARWLARKFTPWEFAVFGGGIRRCIGAAFALYAMKHALAALLPRHRFRLLEDRPVTPVRRNITLGPRGGIRMVLTERTGQPPAPAGAHVS
ncbi:MAG TPA: cytochrome P450 [Nannocystis sp.]|jgi:cytochrome P450